MIAVAIEHRFILPQIDVISKKRRACPQSLASHASRVLPALQFGVVVLIRIEVEVSGVEQLPCQISPVRDPILPALPPCTVSAAAKARLKSPELDERFARVVFADDSKPAHPVPAP